MRKHAPMWEAELGLDSGENDIEVYSRKFIDDMEEARETASDSQRPSWVQLLLFLTAMAIFLTIALGVPFRA